MEVDTAVTNILRLKFEMGLLKTYVEPSKAKQVVNQKHKIWY